MDFELIQYYLRKKYYYSAELAGAKAIQINLKSSVYQLYYGLSFVLQNKLSKGLSILDTLVQTTDVGLASTLVIIHAHKKFEVFKFFNYFILKSQNFIQLCFLILQVPDISTINTFESTIDEYSHSETVLFHAANVLILCDLSEKAISYIDQLLLEYPSSVDGYLIKGWLELNNNKLKNARNCFKAVLSQVSYIYQQIIFNYKVMLYVQIM